MPAPHLTAYFQDRLSEQQITLTQAAKLLPSRNGKNPSLSCLYRWASKGVKGVVLETWSVGGIRVTSREAIARFLADLNQDRQSKAVARRVAERSAALARARAEVASKRLDDLGI